MTRILFGIVLALSGVVASIGLRQHSAAALVVPTPAGRIGGTTVSKDSTGTVLTVQTSRGQLRYRWQPDFRTGQGAGTIMIESPSAGVPLAVRYALEWAGRQVDILSSDFQISGGRAILIQRVAVDRETLTLTLRARLDGGSLVLEMDGDKPMISALQIAPPEAAGVNRITLPYNPVALYRLGSNGPVVSSFLDWSASAATRYEEGNARYDVKTDGQRNPLHERLIVTESDQVASVLPNSSWSRSRYYDRVGGRLVVDVTETLPFSDIETGLDRLIGAGLSDCIFIVHVWQKMGYDNGLPVVLPANAFLGGSERLREIGRKAKAVNCEFALHQNYIDQYRNSGEFEPAAIAKDGKGQMYKAWLNPGAGQQSYSLRPDRLAAMVQRYAPAIRNTLGTTAAFVDVNSSVEPWERTDMEAAHPDAGRFSAFIAGSKAMFEALQSVEKGPVLGEGHQHFYWTGALDGVEAQMSVGYGGDIRRAPLWVDFDLLKIHPNQHNFGMGFYNRYAPATATSRDPMTEEHTRDLYRTQQLAFGHLPYRSQTLWADPRLFVQEAALSGSVARSYRDATVTEIRYPIDRQWVPIEAALARNAGQAVRVRYNNGLVVTANTGSSFVLDERKRPVGNAGWSAYGSGLEGWSTTMGEGRRDFMRDAGNIYADPRTLAGNWVRGGNGQVALVDFGPLRTNGQTWLRCVSGHWTVLGFAERGAIDIEVERSAVSSPLYLRSPDAADVRIEQGRGPDSWRARIESGRRYTTSASCRTTGRSSVEGRQANSR